MAQFVYSMESCKLVRHLILTPPDHMKVFTAKSEGRAGKFMSTLGDVYFATAEECAKACYKEEQDAILETELELAMLHDALNEAKIALPSTFEEYYQRAMS